MIIRRANVDEAGVAAELAVQMWTSSTVEEHKQGFEEYIKEGGAVFLAWKDNEAVGFAQCGMRHDYVEGTESSPVGYLEGIFVAEKERKQGIAKELLRACQNYAREMGCSEFASDCELENEDSLKFHIAMGFEEANRIICFTKKLFCLQRTDMDEMVF